MNLGFYSNVIWKPASVSWRGRRRFSGAWTRPDFGNMFSCMMDSAFSRTMGMTHSWTQPWSGI